KLPRTSIAASAARSSARAEATGSVIPAGTTVRGTSVVVRAALGSAVFSRSVIGGVSLDDAHIGGDGLTRVLALHHLAEPRQTEQSEDPDEHEQQAEHGEGREPGGPPRAQPDDAES